MTSNIYGGTVITTDSLTAKLAPKMVGALEATKDQFFASLNPVQRLACKLLWPRFIAGVPKGVETGLQLVRSEFGQMNLNDLLDWLGKRP